MTMSSLKKKKQRRPTEDKERANLQKNNRNTAAERRAPTEARRRSAAYAPGKQGSRQANQAGTSEAPPDAAEERGSRRAARTFRNRAEQGEGAARAEQSKR